MKNLIKQWFPHISIILVLLTFSWFLFGIKVDASDAKKKTDQIEKTMVQAMELNKQLTEIANELRSPSLWLQNYLLNKDVDSVQASIWSKYHVGQMEDKDGNIILHVPFLNPRYTPEIGILMMFRRGSSEQLMIAILDTLWNFKKE